MPYSSDQPLSGYYFHSVPTITELAQATGEFDTDVCIIGGGYTGLSSAYNLSKAGAKVTLLEAHKIGFGASGRNGGHLCVGQRKDQQSLEKKLGIEKAIGLWQLGVEAADYSKALIAEHSIDCELTPGIMHVAHKKQYAPELQEEVDHMVNNYGYGDLDYLSKADVDDILGTDQFYGGVIDNRAAHVHPLKYALGLKQAALGAGATLYENSPVVRFVKSTSGYVVSTPNATIKAKQLVIACNGYINKLVPSLAGYIMPINNFVIATEQLPEDVALSLIKNRAAVSDTRFVINYWRLSADNRLIFGGGENYRSGFPADIPSFVRKYMLKIYPQLADVKIDSGWGGTLAISLNRMPIMGKLDDNCWYSLGYSGQGVAMATLSGKLISESMSGNSSRFELQGCYPRQRFPGGTLLRWPGMVAGMLYYAMKDRF